MVESMVYKYLKEKKYIIDIAVANGMHRCSTRSEVCKKLQDDLEDSIIYQNHPFQEMDWLEELKEKEEYTVIAMSTPYPHNHVDMSGGDKLVLPGLAHWADIASFHKTKDEYKILKLMRDASKKVIDIYVGISYCMEGCYDLCITREAYEFGTWRDRTKERYQVEIPNLLPDAVILEPCVKNSDFQQSMNAMLIMNKFYVVKRGGTIIIRSMTPDGLGTHYLFQQPNGKSPAFYDEIFKGSLINGRQIHFNMPNVPERGIQQYFKHCKPMNFVDFEDVLSFIKARHGLDARVTHYTAPDISIGVKT